MSGQEEPKIIIDSDWKTQARAEKERLAQSSAKPAKPGAPTGEGAGTAAAPGPGDPVGFRDLLSLLISQALAYLGAYPDPRTGQAIVALEPARFHIDLLGVLEAKTKGNLTDDEARILSRAVNELRLEYVDVAKAVSKAIEEGRTTTVAPGAGAGPVTGGSVSPKITFPGGSPGA